MGTPTGRDDTLSTLVALAKDHFDLTAPGDRASLQHLAEQLLALDLSDAELERTASQNAPLEFRIAAKLVASRRRMLAIRQPVRVAVVFAMWGEHHRLQPRSATNPNGEDSLRVKLDQLAWATDGTPIDWTLYAVDDGDPHHSGDLASRIAAEHPRGGHVTVLKLADAVPTDSGPLQNLTSADDSRKGGAIVLGARRALDDGNDAVVYTDADNSVHLGQIGLLLEPFVAQRAQAVWGDRKDPRAVLVKQEARWGIGIKVLRHMQRMVGQEIFSRGIGDTQAAFKLYGCELLERILEQPGLYDFSFDTDWMLAVLTRDEAYEQVPFAFIDSAAESASIVQGPMTTWETLLKGLVAAVRLHGARHDEEMARVIDEEIGSSADLDTIIDHLPPQLEHATNEQLGDRSLMSPAELRAWIRERKQAANTAGP